MVDITTKYGQKSSRYWKAACGSALTIRGDMLIYKVGTRQLSKISRSSGTGNGQHSSAGRNLKGAE